MAVPVTRALMRPKSDQHAFPRHAVRVLIKMSAGGTTLLPLTARLVITSGRGAPLAEVAYTWQNAAEDEAALRAVLEALKIAKRYQAERVVVYIDNERAVSVVRGVEKIPRELVGLALQIRALAHTYRAFDVRCGMSVVAPTLLDVGSPVVSLAGEHTAGAHEHDNDPASHYHLAKDRGRTDSTEDEAKEWTS